MSKTPAQDWYHKLYSEEFWALKYTPAAMRDKASGRAKKYIDALSGRTIRTILDVGAGYGQIGDQIAEGFGARAYTIEPSKTASAYIQEHSTSELLGPSLTDIEETDKRFDLILFSHSLENIVDPRSAILIAKGLLSDSGILLIESPNVNWQPSMHIYHPHCYSASSLTALLSICGMKTISVAISGRPASSVIPRYLTVLAETGTETRRVPSITSTHRIKLQHLVTKIVLRGNR